MLTISTMRRESASHTRRGSCSAARNSPARAKRFSRCQVLPWGLSWYTIYHHQGFKSILRRGSYSAARNSPARAKRFSCQTVPCSFGWYKIYNQGFESRRTTPAVGVARPRGTAPHFEKAFSCQVIVGHLERGRYMTWERGCIQRGLDEGHHHACGPTFRSVSVYSGSPICCPRALFRSSEAARTWERGGVRRGLDACRPCEGRFTRVNRLRDLRSVHTRWHRFIVFVATRCKHCSTHTRVNRPGNADASAGVSTMGTTTQPPEISESLCMSSIRRMH
jgi:hypothetical protein